MSDEARSATIAALLAEVPPEELAAFDAYYQRRLQQALQHASQQQSSTALDIDPDAVEEALIAQLMRAADGLDHPEGMGEVPTDEDVYSLIPPDTDPRLAPAAGGRSGGRLGGPSPAGTLSPARKALLAALGVGLLLFLVWSLGGQDSEAAEAPTVVALATVSPAVAPTPTALAEVSSGDVTVFSPSSLELRPETGAPEVYRVVASESALGGTWTPSMPEGAAAWLMGTVVNQVFCVPASAEPILADLTRGSTITVRPASGAVRTFAVVRQRTVGRQEVEVLDQRRAGLTLIRCGTAGNTRQVIEATEAGPPQEPPTLRRGQAGTLPDLARLTVETVTVLPPDATLPPGVAEVQVTVQVSNTTSAPIRAHDLADQLLLPAMVAERLPPLHADLDAYQARRVTFRYHVPEAGGDATWRVQSATGTLVWQLVIPAAPTARQPYTAAVVASGITLTAAGDGWELAIPLTLTATSTDGATVTPEAVQVWVGGRSLPLSAASSPLPVVLDGTTPTTVMVAAVIPDVGHVEVQVGSQRWRLTLP